MQDYYIEGDYDNLIIAVEKEFKQIKNKFVYPVGALTGQSFTPAKYVHKCDRKSDCHCIALISYLLVCMSNESTLDLQSKLDELIFEPRSRMPY